MLALLVALPAAVRALDYSYTASAGEVTITRYTGSGGVVTIPSMIDGLPVTGIAASAFQSCTGLTSVTIPNSVISIGDRAFSNCQSLTSVTIPASVTSFEGVAFPYCKRLTTITVDPANAVYSSVDGLVFDKNQTALLECPGGRLGSYTIPDGVTAIANDAFSYCVGLTDVTIPASMSSIGDRAFVGTGLTAIAIPASVTTIGYLAFGNCTGLTAITVDSRNPFCSSVDGVLFNRNQDTLIQCPAGRTGDYAIPAGVMSIGDWAFSSCAGLTTVTIPASVTRIGDSAFASCSSLTSVTIPAGVTSIGGWAFYNCDRLTSVTIPASVTSIGDSAFDSCNGLTTIIVDGANSVYSSADGILLNRNQTTLIQYPVGRAGSYRVPNSVKAIAGSAFGGCRSLTGVTIPAGVSSIGGSAFVYCTGLTSVTIPASVSFIDNAAFAHCVSLLRADFLGNAPSMGTAVFDGCAPGFMVHYTAGKFGFTTPAWNGYRSSVRRDTPQAFTFGDVTNAEFGALCISGAVTVLGTNTPAAISIAGGEYAVSTNGGATWSAFSTSSPAYVNSGDQVKLRVTAAADYDTAVSATLSIGSVSDTWSVMRQLQTDFWFSDFGTGIQVTGYPGRDRAVVIPATIHGKPVTAIGSGAFEHRNLTSVTIPATVTSIGNSAFHGCTYLTSVTIPDGVMSLGVNAFSGCTGLTGVIIPASVTSIGIGAFLDCAGLTSITIPDSVISLGSAAFYACRGLTSVAIGNRVGSIGARTFWDCSRLLSVTIPDSVTSIDEWAFWNCTSLTSATLGSHVATIEGLAFGNCTSLTSITIPDSVTTIGNMAFEDCSRLTSVAIGRSVTSIGQRAFAGCASLTSVSLPDSVTRFDYAAFMDCSSLTGVTIGSGVTSIGQQAFGGCPSLTSADFRGDAPAMDLAVFLGCAASFTVYHIPGKKGFTSPKWNGHPSTIRATRPDFVITDIRLDPPVPVRGGTFTACVTVQNVGTKAPHGASLLAWVDRADNASASLPADQAATVGALKSGQLQIVRFSALRAGADGGPYVFRTFVDAEAQTAETDETNNQRTLTWHAGRPDFVVTAIRFLPNPPVAGKTFAASVTVRNIGDSPGDAGSVDVWVNGRCEAPPGPGLRGDKTAGAGTMFAGQQKTLTFTSLAAPTDDAAQEFLAIVDSRTRTIESNETNNALSRSFLPARPDFVITAIELAPEPVICGQTFTAYVTVQNAGTAAGRAGYLHVWLDRVAASEPELNTHGDKYAPVGTLVAGQEKRLTFTSLRAGPSPQRRILRVYADYRNQTVEASDANNESAREYSCVPSP